MIVNIYGLFDPTTKELRYIGKTERTLTIRLSQHIYEVTKQRSGTHKAMWIKSLLKGGLKPEIDIIELADNLSWAQKEQQNIEYFRAIGCRLTNTTIGGDTSRSTPGGFDFKTYNRKYSKREDRKKYMKEYLKNYLVKNRDEINTSHKEWIKEHPDVVKAYHQKYRDKNKEKRRLYNIEYRKRMKELKSL